MTRFWHRLRFVASWGAAVALLVTLLPRAVDVSWHGVLPVLGLVHWPAALALTGVWFLGLWVHSFVLTAAAPALNHRRALTLNLTGSAVSNVVPLGGAAGVELNRRMMRAWGIDARSFTGYTFLTNLWDVASKLLLPVVALAVLVHAGEVVTPQVRTASLVAGVGFVVVVAAATLVLASPRGAVALGRVLESAARRALRLVGRDRPLGLAAALLEVRAQCAGLVARGWLRMSAGIAGYVALQGLLLGLCLQLTGGGNTWPEVLAAFAVERALTVVPLTPGGVGVADLGLVAVLLALGGNPAAVAGAAVLYRAFVFLVEIPVGSGALGLWLLGQRLTGPGSHRAARDGSTRPWPPTTRPRRVAHVSDVFLPRLGGIETHVDDLVRHQRARGLQAEVLTPARTGLTRPADAFAATRRTDPGWVRRMPAADACRAVTDYDVVHVHVSMFSPYGISVARAATRAGVPVLVTVHSMWNGAGGVLRLAALAGLRRWPVVWSAVSGAAAQAFGRSLAGVEVEVLPDAIDVASWRPGAAGSAAPSAPQSGDDRPVTVISVMRLMPRKRPVQLVRTFARVRRLTGRDDLRLVLVGDGPLRGRVERRVRRLGLEGRVRVTGRLSREGVRDELAAATLYVSPAARESFGIAALEARSAGLPVVASRRSGVGEFVHDRVDGLLVDGDAEMAVALADLVCDPVLLERLTDHNRAVAPSLDWSDALDRTRDLYAAALTVAARRAGAPTPASPAPVAVAGA